MNQRRYKAKVEFTAQGRNIQSLMKLYSILEDNADIDIPMTPFVVFMAFSIEAYINAVGYEKISYWKEVEGLSWKKKMNILHHSAGKKFDWGKNPLQFANEVFSIRDKLAHGKPEEVSRIGIASEYKDEREFMRKVVPDWYSKINRDWVIESKPLFSELMNYIGSLHGFHKYHYSLIYFGVVEAIMEP